MATRLPVCEEHAYISKRMAEIEADRRAAQAALYEPEPSADFLPYRHPRIVASRFWHRSDRNAEDSWFIDNSRNLQKYIEHVQHYLPPSVRLRTAQMAYTRPRAEGDIVRNIITMFCRLFELDLIDLVNS